MLQDQLHGFTFCFSNSTLQNQKQNNLAGLSYAIVINTDSNF